MSDQSPAEKVKYQLSSLQSDLNELQKGVRLVDISDSLEDLGSSVAGLERRVRNLREGGYAFEKDLESQAADFQRQWAEMAPGLEEQVQNEAAVLSRALRPLENQLAQLTGDPSRPDVLLPRLEGFETRLGSLEGKVEAAESSLRGQYDGFSGDVGEFKSHLYRLEWTMEEISEATFQLLAAESPIMAVKAVWAKGGKQTKSDPEGVLYLTDQRILFEQKEKVATKKILFVATEKELVQELLWEVPVTLLENARAHKQGFLNKDDYLELKLAAKAFQDLVHIHIWHPGADWVSYLNRARAGEYDQNRAIPISQEVLDRIKNAPTKCPSCGGAIQTVILRGMDHLDCEYCGDVIRW